MDGSDLNITIPDKEIVRLTLEVLSAPESITDASIYSTLTGKTSNGSDVCYKSSDFAENVHLTTKETHPAVIHHLRILLPSEGMSSFSNITVSQKLYAFFRETDKMSLMLRGPGATNPEIVAKFLFPTLNQEMHVVISICKLSLFPLGKLGNLGNLES